MHPCRLSMLKGLMQMPAAERTLLAAAGLHPLLHHLGTRRGDHLGPFPSAAHVGACKLVSPARGHGLAVGFCAACHELGPAGASLLPSIHCFAQCTVCHIYFLSQTCLSAVVHRSPWRIIPMVYPGYVACWPMLVWYGWRVLSPVLVISSCALRMLKVQSLGCERMVGELKAILRTICLWHSDIVLHRVDGSKLHRSVSHVIVAPSSRIAWLKSVHLDVGGAIHQSVIASSHFPSPSEFGAGSGCNHPFFLVVGHIPVGISWPLFILYFFDIYIWCLSESSGLTG